MTGNLSPGCKSHMRVTNENPRSHHPPLNPLRSLPGRRGLPGPPQKESLPSRGFGACSHPDHRLVRMAARTDEPTLIALRTEALDLAEALEHVSAPEFGGTAIFVGSVRPDLIDRGPLEALEYEAYPDVVEKVMRTIADEAQANHGASRVAMLHRVGRLQPGEIVVIVAAACPHRSQAFEACRYLIDELKHRAPIWKREWANGGGEWVQCVH